MNYRHRNFHLFVLTKHPHRNSGTQYSWTVSILDCLPEWKTSLKTLVIPCYRNSIFIKKIFEKYQQKRYFTNSEYLLHPIGKGKLYFHTPFNAIRVYCSIILAWNIAPLIWMCSRWDVSSAAPECMLIHSCVQGVLLFLHHHFIFRSYSLAFQGVLSKALSASISSSLVKWRCEVLSSDDVCFILVGLLWFFSM